METRGIIMYNCGTKCLVRAIVCLYSLRKYYNGAITFFIEESTTPKEFDDVCKYFNVDVVKLPGDSVTGALIKKTKTLWNTPYDKTLWIDADMVIVGKIDEMFSYLNDNYSFSIPNFCRWWSDGKGISRRIKRFNGLVSKEILDEALKHYPAINTGIFSYKKQTKFLKQWIDLAIQTNGKRIFISDEIACQVLMPQFKNEIYIADPKFNVSVLYGNEIEDKRVIHFHGSKHCLSSDVLLCDIWKATFKEMCDANIANINSFLKYADKRLGRYLRGEKVWGKEEKKIGQGQDVTIVSACDPYYVEILKWTFPNWIKYKHIDKYPVIIFINSIELNDSRLDFLRLPNVQLIPWSKEKDLDNVTDHREEMLSAFFIGAARYVKTDYWLKLDSDSIATDNREFITPAMKQYSIFSHRWGYSRPDHIRALDSWVLTCPKHRRKLALSKPMIEQGRIEGRRFYHNSKRFISYICLQKTRFTRFCVGLFKERRMPCSSQDTTAYFLIQKFKPEAMGIGNFKRDYGFTQLRGKMGAAHIKKCVEEVDRINDAKESAAKENLNNNSTETSEEEIE